jgi:hypothetical protein
MYSSFNIYPILQDGGKEVVLSRVFDHIDMELEGITELTVVQFLACRRE